MNLPPGRQIELEGNWANDFSDCERAYPLSSQLWRQMHCKGLQVPCAEEDPITDFPLLFSPGLVHLSLHPLLCLDQVEFRVV